MYMIKKSNAIDVF